VIGCDTAITLGGMSGHLQMNSYKPLLIHNTLLSIELLSDASSSFATRCVAGLDVSRETVSRNVERSAMLATALSPKLGYDRAAEVAKKAEGEGLTLKQSAIALGYLTAEEFDALVRPADMAGRHGLETDD
jgi:fumarate hydratase class II